MGTNIAQTSEGFGKASDKSWIGAQMGLDTMRSITLAVSAFGTSFDAQGYIPSGVPLSKATTGANSGKYVLYDNVTANAGDVLAGFLFEEVKLSKATAALSPNVGAALFWTGIIREARLPAYWAALTATPIAAGKVDVASWIRFE